jgi:hypothetical protein
MRLKFVGPLMPTAVEQPPEGDDLIAEVKFTDAPFASRPRAPLLRCKTTARHTEG